MIIKLLNGQVIIKQMTVPEPTQMLRIKYEFELDTNHLTPELYINRELMANEHAVQIALSNAHVNGDQLDVVVKLRDANTFVVKEYKTTAPIHKYIILGEKPLYPDFELYVQSLLDEIEKLKEEGEVI